ncbi:MAG TPA: hypothetical protein PLF01_04535, partial [Alphaproteobacteria bacterium]|nr:hypothetical protein [Alphaproteobacteria bacterium]
MSICRVRKWGLLLAGFGLLASPFIVTGVMAEAPIPKPQTKPTRIQAQSVSYVAPLPDRKPEQEEEEQAAETAEPIVVAEATKEEIAYAPALPEVPKARFLFHKSVFSDKQARLYREIFDLQNKGDIEGANKRLAGLNNSVLMGHILAERYLNQDTYKANYKELHDWMEKYADHPQAAKIYKLALSRKELVAKKKLHHPVSHRPIMGNLAVVGKKGKIYQVTKNRSPQEQTRVRKLSAEIRTHVERREPTMALNILSTDYAVQFMDDVEYDRLRAQIAAGYLYAGKLEQATQLAEASLKRSGGYVPLAGWVKGLVFWQLADYEKAAQAFETAATSPYASGWMVSAAAYW